MTATTGSISLSGGTIPHSLTPPSPPGACVITATVTSSIVATYTNSIPVGALTAINSTTLVQVSNILAANAALTVYGSGVGVTGTKSFAPTTIQIGGVSTLTINLRRAG